MSEILILCILAVILTVIVLVYTLCKYKETQTYAYFSELYRTPGPKSYDFFNTLVTRYDCIVPVYEGCRNTQIYTPSYEEVQSESRNLIPVTGNLRLLKPGDYVISDTCYSSEDLRSFLSNYISFANDLHIVATRNGKEKGTV